MTTPPREPELERSLTRLLTAAGQRQALVTGLGLAVRVAIPWGVAILTVHVGLARFFAVPWAYAGLAATPLAFVLVVAALRRPTSLESARILDTALAQHDLFEQALAFATWPAEPGHRVASPGREPDLGDPRTRAFAALVVADAERVAQHVALREVMPIRTPRPSPHLAWGIIALAAVSFAPLPATSHDEVPSDPSLVGEPPPPASPQAALASATRASIAVGADLADLRAEHDAAASMAQQIEATLQALARGEIDARTALVTLDALEQQLLSLEHETEDQLAADAALLARALREAAVALDEDALTQPLADALTDLDGASTERALSEALGRTDETSEAAARKALDAALERAAKRLATATTGEPKAADLREAERRLAKQEPTPPRDEADERRLGAAQNALESLRRRQARSEATRSALQQLSRDAKATARAKDGAARAQAGASLGRGLREAAQRSRAKERLARAKDALDEARSFIRRGEAQEGSGPERERSLRRFQRAAEGSGKRPPGDRVLGSVEAGDESRGEGEEAGSSPGDPESQVALDGAPSAESGAWAPAPDGMGEGTASPIGQEQAQRSRPTQDLRVDAQQGRGATRAEVVRDASQRGFASEAYRDVYRDYRAFAQSSLESEPLSTSHQRRVKRYFRLIAPR